MGEGDVPHVGELLENELAGPPFVVRVDEAEEEADGDRLDAQLLEALHAPPYGHLVEREHDVALEVTAFGNRDPGPATGNRMGRRVGRIPDVLLVVAAQLDLVAVAFGGQQPGGGAAHLDHGVVGGGRAVHERLQAGAEGRAVDAETGRQLPDPGDHAIRLVGWRGGGLVQYHLAIRGDADEVGEGAAHVHPDPVPTLRHARPPRGRPMGGAAQRRS